MGRICAGTVVGVLKRRWPIIVFVVWTVYVWTTRIVNAWSASDESTTAKVISTASAVVLLGLGIAVARVLVVARARAMTAGESRLVMILAAGTIVVWVVRVPQLLLDDRGAAFKVVHLVLGAISVGLAALSIRRARAESHAEDEPARAVSPAANGAR